MSYMFIPREDTRLMEPKHEWGERCECGHHRDWHGDRHLPLPCAAVKCFCFGWKQKFAKLNGSYVSNEE